MGILCCCSPGTNKVDCGLCVTVEGLCSDTETATVTLKDATGATLDTGTATNGTHVCVTVTTDDQLNYPLTLTIAATGYDTNTYSIWPCWTELCVTVTGCDYGTDPDGAVPPSVDVVFTQGSSSQTVTIKLGDKACAYFWPADGSVTATLASVPTHYVYSGSSVVTFVAGTSSFATTAQTLSLVPDTGYSCYTLPCCVDHTLSPPYDESAAYPSTITFNDSLGDIPLTYQDSLFSGVGGTPKVWSGCATRTSAWAYPNPFDLSKVAPGDRCSALVVPPLKNSGVTVYYELSPETCFPCDGGCQWRVDAYVFNAKNTLTGGTPTCYCNYGPASGPCPTSNPDADGCNLGHIMSFTFPIFTGCPPDSGTVSATIPAVTFDWTKLLIISPTDLIYNFLNRFWIWPGTALDISLSFT